MEEEHPHPHPLPEYRARGQEVLDARSGYLHSWPAVSDPQSIPESSSRSDRLKELALLFLRLGFTAFGGPPAHVAMMEDEVVRRRQWLDRQHFLDLVAAVNFVPGPNSTELAIHIG